MTYLRCRSSRSLGCPWKINDETHDSEGQRIEHERECAAFIRKKTTAKVVADQLAVERVAHLVRAA